MSISRDISEKIDKNLRDTLMAIEDVSRVLKVPFLVVGATARDLIFNYVFDLKTYRATKDLDVAVWVNNWEKYKQIETALIASGGFAKDHRTPHRFRFGGTVLVDIIPFGGLENPPRKIFWPSTDGTTMLTYGFEEVYIFSVEVKISNNPDVLVRVATPAGLAVLKLISWKEDFPNRSKDASDLYYIMNKYLDAGNQDRIFSTDEDLISGGEVDYLIAGARLLGRDMRTICNETTKSVIEKILREETSDVSELNLVSDMVQKSQFDKEESFQRARLMLLELFNYFTNKKKN